MVIRFIVIILAAGMVAFVGAVICIIAAVHTGSAAESTQQPVADNQSQSPYAGVQQTFPGGSVARAGPLGAIHGSERQDGEAPTFFHLASGSDAVGGTRQVSRLICTPFPAGECNPKNVQQQADDPSLYAGEDWGYLRTTAEELQQTVLQQKDQIITDQRTIRDLSGKLSECESGIEGRRGAGLWGGKRVDEGRLVVRDSAPSSTVAQLLTAQAVDELEQAIVQMKDRIEKLESDIGPLAFPHNHTDAATAMTSRGGGGGLSEAPDGWGEAGPGGQAGDGPKQWPRLEDLEGELERKLELLEKERKALRKESQRHRQEIDQGMNSLHHRIAGLEEGLSEYTYPEGYKLSFPARTNYMYAVVHHPIPELRAFTVCLWLRPTEGGIGTPFSYAVAEQPNELVLLQGMHTPVELLINNKVAQLPLNLSRGSWHHICVSWSQRGGAWQAYQGGKLRGEGQGLAAWHHIRPGGVLILGQEQDTLGGRFDSSQAMVGELSQWNVWEQVLTPSEVSSLAHCSQHSPQPKGNVAPWTNREVEVFGGATKVPMEPCAAKYTNTPL
ncbi:neuronal pentraxin receptor-like [Salvelinus namaycush]|uniref:Neuronal pentraxin receptor-like n=1 Tax=Salvelinus namaycush TaxID=8040 RepID=A0A8U0Q6J2_SALNM|nr:neuronal pentraxin receptor-like [Salvelinus namaycush]